jgi:hypothetical protein
MVDIIAPTPSLRVVPAPLAEILECAHVQASTWDIHKISICPCFSTYRSTQRTLMLSGAEHPRGDAFQIVGRAPTTRSTPLAHKQDDGLLFLHARSLPPST